MTLGKLTTACWIVFGVMCIGFLPLAAGVYSIPGLPGSVRAVLVVVVVLVVWWGPFVYGMYLAQAGMGSGDRRLLKRGVHGTALVLKASMTNTSLGGTSSGWGGRFVYRYHLRVSLPGREPYETYCMIAYSGIKEGQTVQVAASPHNRKRVTIDVGQGTGKLGSAPPRPVRQVEDDVPRRYQSDGARHHHPKPANPETSTRIQQLAALGKLHREGVLTDAEFAAEKARILNE